MTTDVNMPVEYWRLKIHELCFKNFRGTLLDTIQSTSMGIYKMMFIFLIMRITGNPKKTQTGKPQDLLSYPFSLYSENGFTPRATLLINLCRKIYILITNNNSNYTNIQIDNNSFSLKTLLVIFASNAWDNSVRWF